MKKIIFIFLLSSVGYATWGQSVSGKVEDMQHKPVPYANVVLLASDSSFIAGDVTNGNGLFTIPSKKGEKKGAWLKVTCIGYQDTRIPLTTKANASSYTISLHEKASRLNEITVHGHLPPVKLQAGAVTINVANSPLSKETDIMDILRKVPGLMINNNQLTPIAGGSLLIYIDGRKIESINEIKQLEIRNIRNIALNTNPGAEYDASVGAVLLITTKQRMQGLSLQVDGNTKHNRSWSNTEEIKANYQTGKLNLFGSLSHDDARKKSIQNMYLTNTSSDLWEHYLDVLGIKQSDRVVDYSAGFNYDLTPRHTFGVLYDEQHENYLDFSLMPDSSLLNHTFYDKIDSRSHINDKNYMRHLNMYYSGTLTRKLSLNAYADYVKNHTCRDQRVEELSEYFSSDTVQSVAISDYDLYAFKGELQYDLSQSQTISAGTELSHIKGNGSTKFASGSDNNSLYSTQENKMAYFVKYSLTLHQFSLDAGVRYEYVKSDNTDLLNPAASIYRRYSNLFPSIDVNLTSGGITQSLSYRISTKRPPFGWLGAYSTYVNRYELQVGNPALVPEISHRFQYMLTYRFIYLSASYTYKENSMGNAFSQDSTDPTITIFSWKNYKKEQNINLVANGRYRFGMYEPNLTVAWQKNYLTVDYLGKPVNIDKPFAYIDFNNYLHFPLNMLFNAEYIYTGGGSMQLFTFKATNVFNVSLQKSFFNNNLTVTLKANDLFRGDIDRIAGAINNIYFSQREDEDRHAFSIHVTWKFNNYKKEYKGKSAAQKEIDRL